VRGFRCAKWHLLGAGNVNLFRLTFLNGSGGFADDVDHDVRLGEHGDVAAVGLGRGRVHTFRQKTLKVGMHSLVLLRDDVPAQAT
jgi:hypothetical protein